MTIRRSITHREFSVRTAGWFTVLKPDGWFPALHRPSRQRNLSSQTVETAVAGHAESRETSNALLIMLPTARNFGLMDRTLIILTAIVITSALLWWIMHP